MQLTKEQYKILKRISKGKYKYPDISYDIRSEAFQNIAKLTDAKLIDYDLNPGDDSYYKDFSLTIEGQLVFETHSKEKRNNLRWWVTTAIALAGLLNSMLIRFGI